MYRLMKSEKFELEDIHGRSVSIYRQKEVTRFLKFDDATAACNVANAPTNARCYLLNGAGQEYYAGDWIE